MIILGMVGDHPVQGGTRPIFWDETETKKLDLGLAN